MGARIHSTNDRTYQTLRDQLSHFGLDPFDWEIFSRPKRSNSIELKHRDDPAFRIHVHFRKLRTGLLRVDGLALVSL